MARLLPVAAAAALLLCPGGAAFQASPLPRRARPLPPAASVDASADAAEAAVLEGNIPSAPVIQLSPLERARTVAQVAHSGTFCTLSSEAERGNVQPFGSHVDFILDDGGAPVFLVSDQSVHTLNVDVDPSASLFVQMPLFTLSTPAAALSRVTLMGKVCAVTAPEELRDLKNAYVTQHAYAERLVDSPRFRLCRLELEKVYYVGGFGVLSTWIDVDGYKTATHDMLAGDAPLLLERLNEQRSGDLVTLAMAFMGLDGHDIKAATITSLDRLGLDLRVTHVPPGEADADVRTDEFRVGFRTTIISLEDAKSEVVKILQEAWEQQEGFTWDDQGPIVLKYASDNLR